MSTGKASNGALSRAAILAAADLRTERVPVPEWGGDVWVRQMNGAQLDAYRAEVEARQGVASSALIVALCCCDKSGERLFTAEDVPALMEKSPVALARIQAAAVRVNAMDIDAIGDAKKNSSPGPSAASGSA